MRTSRSRIVGYRAEMTRCSNSRVRLRPSGQSQYEATRVRTSVDPRALPAYRQSLSLVNLAEYIHSQTIFSSASRRIRAISCFRPWLRRGLYTRTEAVPHTPGSLQSSQLYKEHQEQPHPERESHVSQLPRGRVRHNAVLTETPMKR